MTMRFFYQVLFYTEKNSSWIHSFISVAHSKLLRGRETADITTTTLEAMIRKRNDSAF